MPDPTSETMQKVANRIAAVAPAGVWSKADFLDIASPYGIEKALQRLTDQGTIRRVHRGLYDQPATSTLTGQMVFPPRSAFIDAIARRDKLRVIVDGMTAANDLGLTTAVPARTTVHADTHPRTIEIEANYGDPKATAPVIYRLDFKRISARTAFWAGHPAMRIIQALDWFKDDRATEPALINGIVRYLDRSARRDDILADLRENRAGVPSWMYTVIDMIIRKSEQKGDDAA
ncbi:DUF6088 family protein [Asticcacaulis sp. AC402]|uniref:DUF6088 family protein n=1 Tax=Asticcacaulis sp. AC402 TaxID=1282361 RepID=UPI0004CFC35A|nr:DUF6088 family protein [Asticcacaulis sp. AC402]